MWCLENDTANEKNTIVFRLNVSVSRERDAPRLTGMGYPLSLYHYIPDIFCSIVDCTGLSSCSVTSKDLEWLPNGSEFIMASSNESAKPQTYTSFSCSQDSLPEFMKNSIGPVYDDITIDRLGAGQVGN